MVSLAATLALAISAFALGILIGMKIRLLKYDQERILSEGVTPIIKQRNRLADALHEIHRFGKMYPGHGYSCSTMASNALKEEGL